MVIDLTTGGMYVHRCKWNTAHTSFKEKHGNIAAKQFNIGSGMCVARTDNWAAGIFI